MATILDRILESETPPKVTNVIWEKEGVLYRFKDGEWKPITISNIGLDSLLDKIEELENLVKGNVANNYVHIAYSNSETGRKGFSTTDSYNKEYLGIYVDNLKDGSLDPSKYKWTKIKGEQGPKGADGIDGTDGVEGAEGTGTYFHIKYSNSPDGANMNDTDGIYMGTYVDTKLEDSDNPNDYSWKKIKGEDGIPGEQGIPGENGADGKTSYLHLAYANSADGKVDFSVTDSENKIYMGQYVDFEQYDSYFPEDYKWNRIKGVDGDNAIQFYTWLRYADTIEFIEGGLTNENGGNAISGTGISNSPTNEDGSFKKYIGFAYQQVTPEESDNYEDYKWNLAAGADGPQGIPGDSGYTWIKYSDVIPSEASQVYDEPKETTEFIGIATNQKNDTESYDPSMYKWSKFKGDQGIQGEKGEDGQDGKSYEYIYRRTKTKDDVPNTSGLPSDQEDGYVPSGWEDNAIGVSDEYRAEWVCTRIKVNNVWQSWRGPSLWSSYGNDGKDGGDVQYIYRRTVDATAPNNPTPDDYRYSDIYQEKGDYSTTEYIPLNWTDEPLGVSADKPYEWTCVRRKKDSRWEAYSTPALWSKFAKDGKDGSSIKIKGYVETIYDLPEYPEDPSDCYVVDKNLYIWTGTNWKDAGQFKGDTGDNGVSVEWKGSNLSAHPQSPQEGWAYRNTNGVTYIFRNGEWNIMTVDGATSYVLELSNDADSINCNYDGVIVDSIKPVCVATLYYGTSVINNGSVDYSITFDDNRVSGITIQNGELVFSDGFSFTNRVLRIFITAIYNGNTLKKTFTLSKNIPGGPGEDAVKTYLSVSTSIININKSGTVSPTTIKATCYKQVGSNEPVVDTNTTIYYDYNTDTPTTTYNRGNISIDTTKNFITFALKNSEGKYYEIEKVPIIRDGKDGNDGTSISVKGTLTSESELPKPPASPNDCYIIGVDLYVWDGTKWNNVGQFKGKDGESRYLHVAYANSEDGTKDFSTTDDTGRTYIGQYVDSEKQDSNVPGTYSWKKYIGNGINSVKVYYGYSSSQTVKPSEWFEKEPSVQQGYYLWTKTVTDYTDPAMQDTETYTYTYQGNDGVDGQAGSDGIGIQEIRVTYGVSNSYTTKPGSWEYDQPITDNINKYLWQRQIIVYTKGDSKEITQVIGVHGKDGKGISNITTYYYATGVPSSYPSISTNISLWQTDPTKTLYSQGIPFLLSFTRTTFDDGTISDTPVTTIGHYGKNGTDGKAGKTVYPAGEYSETVTYTSTDTTTPYVLYDENYYMLKASKYYGAVDGAYGNPAQDTDYWTKFDKYEAVFAKVGMIDNGTFGAAVFSGNYMFSQYGKTEKGGSIHTDKYQYFNNANPYGDGNTFYPNVCINFLTGETWLNAGAVCFKENGSWDLNGKLKYNNNTDTIDFGRYGRFAIHESGQILDNTTDYIQLESLNSSWPSTNLTFWYSGGASANGMVFYTKNKKYKNAVGSPFYGTLNIHVEHIEGKKIKLFFKNIGAQEYKMNVIFRVHNGTDAQKMKQMTYSAVNNSSVLNGSETSISGYDCLPDTEYVFDCRVNNSGDKYILLLP